MVEHRIGTRVIDVTHPDRVLFPDDGFTKADLADYHLAVAPTLVTHLHDRPLMLQRFPEGIDAKGFYQKDRGRGMANWIRTVEVPKQGGVVHHPVVDDAAALLALTNLSTVSFHRWLSRADRLDRPDLLVVDLDPSTPDFDEVRRAARWTRDLCDELDLVTFLMVTGSRGLHVVVPLDRSAATDEVRSFAEGLSQVLARRHPDELTSAFSKEDRGERLYLDVARNGWAQTTVAPYSVRPRAGAPVAVPITWEELDDPDLRPDGWTIATVPDRLADIGDPWAGMARRGRALGPRRAALDDLLADHAGDLPAVDDSVRLGPPIVRPSKIVCVGLNFRDHAEETGQVPPAEPVLFLKATSSMVGPDDDLVLPRGSVKTDWEVELAVVIGRQARYVATDDALDHVAGYVLHNDYSEREYQLERSGGQWDKGKGCDTFAPLGPFLATADDIVDPQGLDMWLDVNGDRKQSSRTDQMVFDVATLVSYISEFMTLLPGDVISTGTPGGVGLARTPNGYLKAGDVVTLGIEGLGSQTQHVR